MIPISIVVIIFAALIILLWIPSDIKRKWYYNIRGLMPPHIWEKLFLTIIIMSVGVAVIGCIIESRAKYENKKVENSTQSRY